MEITFLLINSNRLSNSRGCSQIGEIGWNFDQQRWSGCERLLFFLHDFHPNPKHYRADQNVLGLLYPNSKIKIGPKSECITNFGCLGQHFGSSEAQSGVTCLLKWPWGDVFRLRGMWVNVSKQPSAQLSQSVAKRHGHRLPLVVEEEKEGG